MLVDRRACSRIGHLARLRSVRVIARRTLTRFVESLNGQRGQRAVKAALDAWFHEVQRAGRRNSAEVKHSCVAASIVSADRAVFNLKGNDYLMAAIGYGRQILSIKWTGTHADYDRIHARTDQYED
jgi:mRNA interferase HigB